MHLVARSVNYVDELRGLGEGSGAVAGTNDRNPSQVTARYCPFRLTIVSAIVAIVSHIHMTIGYVRMCQHSKHVVQHPSHDLNIKRFSAIITSSGRRWCQNSARLPPA